MARFAAFVACVLIAFRDVPAAGGVPTASDVPAGHDVPAPRDVRLGESFELGVGETARVTGEALTVGFEGVGKDSRCPKGEQCVWEGNAIVRVWMQKTGEPRVALELHTSARGPAAAAAYGFTVRLLRLEPHPVTGRAIDKDRYRATLEVQRGEGGSSEGP